MVQATIGLKKAKVRYLLAMQVSKEELETIEEVLEEINEVMLIKTLVGSSLRRRVKPMTMLKPDFLDCKTELATIAQSNEEIKNRIKEGLEHNLVTNELTKLAKAGGDNNVSLERSIFVPKSDVCMY